jgi:hypothetical protein
MRCSSILLSNPGGRATGHAVSQQRLSMEARVSPFGICDEQNDTETGFSQSSVFPHQYHYTMAVHAPVSPGG